MNNPATSYLTNCFSLTLAAHAVLNYYGICTKPPIQKYLSQALLCWGKYVALKHGIIYVGDTVRHLQEDLEKTIPDAWDNLYDDWFTKNAGVMADNLSDNICDIKDVEEVMHYLETGFGVCYSDIDTSKRWWAMVDKNLDLIPLQVKMG